MNGGVLWERLRPRRGWSAIYGCISCTTIFLIITPCFLSDNDGDGSDERKLFLPQEILPYFTKLLVLSSKTMWKLSCRCEKFALVMGKNIDSRKRWRQVVTEVVQTVSDRSTEREHPSWRRLCRDIWLHGHALRSDGTIYHGKVTYAWSFQSIIVCTNNQFGP